jgi:subtilisin family serine protease
LAGFPQQWSNWDGSGAKVLVIDLPYQRGHQDLPYIPNENCGSFMGWDGCAGFLDDHGTHVLGTLAALDNGNGVIGGAHGINEDDLYFFPFCDPANPGYCLQSASAAGIDWGASKGVQVISMSYGGPDYDLSEDAAVWSAHYYDDIVLVAAAGNHLQDDQFPIRYPANLPDVIGVSGHRESPDPLAGWATLIWERCYNELYEDFWVSDWGPHVDISAPFEAWSTVFNDGYAHEMPWCGTSMATPHVSAAVAVMRAKNPTLSNSTIESFLLGSATDAGAAGWDNIFGYGRLNASLAIATVQLPPPPPPPLTAEINGPTAIETWQTCSWTASYTGGSGSVSYKWFKNGAQISTSATVYLSGPPFTLKLTVTRGVEADSDTQYISVGSSGGCGL